MFRRSFLTLAAAAAGALALSVPLGAEQKPQGAVAPKEPAAARISGPYTHENLSIYLVHGPSAPGPVPLTLAEAMAKGTVEVHETGSVNALAIENTGAEEVFIQAGDIVKGGKQDRVLTLTMVLAPKSGRVPIGSFCVEQGRWAARGIEDVKRFASAEAALPSKQAKMALLAPMPAPPARATLPAAAGAGARELRLPAPGTVPMPNVAEQRVARTLPVDDTSARQREVWRNVAETQEKLAGALGGSVRSANSASSLQLSLESQRLGEARKAFVAALQPVAEKDGDVIGYVFAVDGRLNSADLYPSNGLFRKMWPKMITAAATEAIGEKGKAKASVPGHGQGSAPAYPAAQPAPAPDAVKAFLESAERGAPVPRSAPLPPAARLETRDGDNALYVVSRRADGAVMHKNYLAK